MTESAWRDMALLLFCWIGYFALHSVLASLAVKRRVAAASPNLMPYYRLGFNMLAVLLLLPILWLTYRDPGPMLWRWQGIGAWLANGLALAAIFGFWLSLKSYDMQEFLGFRQFKFHIRRVEDQEHFHLSPFHRFVRHPWYFFGLVMVWTRDMSAATLLSSVMITVYFIVGSRLEEKKLLVYHGDTYRRYMARVPGLIPLPWRSLTAEEAEVLLKQADGGNRKTRG
jgi:protein-S-isoprenylcysteine O-methyltransferase Ste14